MSIPTEAFAAAAAERDDPETGPWASLNEERREIFEIVRGALAAEGANAERAAACSYLLHHLFETPSTIQ
jgi:hypothetical protein